MRKILLFVVAVSVLSSCITLKEPQVRNINNVNADGLFSGHPKISFDVVLYNPNSIGMSMTDLSLQVKNGNTIMAEIKNDKTFYAAPMTETAIPLSIEPTIQQMNSLIQAGLGGGDLGKFNGSGTVTVRKFLFSKKFQIQF